MDKDIKKLPLEEQLKILRQGAMDEYVSDADREPLIKVRNLSVGFITRGKKTHVIRNVNLDVYKGETLAIVGESGSGKSVFTKTFTGMLDSNGRILGGNIFFDGNENAKVGDFGLVYLKKQYKTLSNQTNPISTTVQNKSIELTENNEIVGTFQYAPPEQLTLKSQISTKVSI